MSGNQVHYEVFVRRQVNSTWTLDMACEERDKALEAAKTALAENRVIAARVTKETLDEETREFRSVTIFNEGAPERKKGKERMEDRTPLCVSPQDLYTAHARDRIGRLLDNWLTRQKATPFELLHRPDLVEKLEASGVELQHAIQKIAVPEAQAKGVGVHEIIRSFQDLIERAIQRLIKDSRRGALPNIDKEGFAQACRRLAAEPERGYLLGAAVAASIAPARTWREKVGRLLDLADAAPAEPAPRAIAFEVIEQPLAEILGSRTGLSDLLGGEMDVGDQLAAMTRLAGADAVEMLIKMEPGLVRILPELDGPAARLANWLGGEHFAGVRLALAKRVLAELNGPRRLKPGDAAAEIEYLRALAMALTAASGPSLPLPDIQEAFIGRSRTLVASDFVEALVGRDRPAREEFEALIRLAENVTGPVNKCHAARWLMSAAKALKFEREFREGPFPEGASSPVQRMAVLAKLQAGLNRSGLPPEDQGPIQARLGEIGGMIEADSRIVASILRAPAPVVHKLTLLLRMAMGEAAPAGPAADRAKAEAMKLIRLPEFRTELAASPEAVAKVRDLMQSAGLAA
jgi:hypothetical protein